jgi:flagellar secretion chaperone FliS
MLEDRMVGYSGAKAADQYLAQRIEAASPEQLVAILLEGGQKYLTLVLAALQTRDMAGMARNSNRVLDFITELKVRVNREQGGELVENLIRIYDSWTEELTLAAMNNQPQRLEHMRGHMGELRATWEALHRKKYLAAAPVAARTSLDELVG